MKQLGLLWLLLAVGCGVRSDWIVADIMRAEDARSPAALSATIDRLGPGDRTLAARAALAAGRIPDWQGWQKLARRFGKIPAVANALAVAMRMPETGFPKADLGKWLASLAPTDTVTVSLLYLDDPEATRLALSRTASAEAVAANLWRAKTSVDRDTVSAWYQTHPEATVFTVSRLKLKGIIQAEDLADMGVSQRYYGCGVCDDPARFLDDPDWRVRIAALRTVTDWKQVLPLLDDPNPLVQVAALAAFGKAGGALWRIQLDRLSPMGAERILAATKDEAVARRIFDKGGRFSAVAAPFMPAFESNRVMAAPIPVARKLAFVEKVRGLEAAVSVAREAFHTTRDAGALQYLLDKLPKTAQGPVVAAARQAGGPLLSVLDDFGYHQRNPEPGPLVGWLQRMRDARALTTFTVRTAKGDLTCRFFPEAAPLTCLNFSRLARQGFFNGRYFHRVVPAFVAQDGDPTGTGSGGPGWHIRCEYNELAYDRPGRIGMALAGKDTGGSQYFLTHLATPWLDHRYTIFAQVTSGMEVLAKLEQYDSIREIVIDDRAGR